MRRRLTLVWGAESELIEEIQGTAHMVELALDAAVRRLGARPGETVVIVGGHAVPGQRPDESHQGGNGAADPELNRSQAR